MLKILKVGAADYIAVAKNYHTVFISEIPMMSMRIRDKVISRSSSHTLVCFILSFKCCGFKLVCLSLCWLGYYVAQVAVGCNS